MIIEQREILFTNVVEVSKAANRAVDKGDGVMDFHLVKRVDSSAIALVLDLFRRAQAKGLQLTVKNPPESFKRLEKLYGLNGILSSTQVETT